jgi:hypothetical protein
MGRSWEIALRAVGLYAANAHFWPLPSIFLTGAAAASGIAWANSLGILAGGITPPAKLAAEDTRRAIRTCHAPTTLAGRTPFITRISNAALHEVKYAR